MSAYESTKLFLQHMLPKHFLSRLAGKLTNSRNKTIKSFLINWFIKKYSVNLTDAQEPDPTRYLDFNDFFTRKLKSSSRPIADGKNQIVSPCDGVISQMGKIENTTLIQAKGKKFILEALLGGHGELASEFINGSYVTFYLAPSDYHRVHMPFAGRLENTIYVPGHLFSVNNYAAENVKGLYSHNERVICEFKTRFGPMIVILVGALFVGSIHTSWGGAVTPSSSKQSLVQHYSIEYAVNLEKGSELGHFQLGSTVIVLFPDNTLEFADGLDQNSAIKMGQLLGELSGK